MQALSFVLHVCQALRPSQGRFLQQDTYAAWLSPPKARNRYVYPSNNTERGAAPRISRELRLLEFALSGKAERVLACCRLNLCWLNQFVDHPTTVWLLPYRVPQQNFGTAAFNPLVYAACPLAKELRIAWRKFQAACSELFKLYADKYSDNDNEKPELAIDFLCFAVGRSFWKVFKMHIYFFFNQQEFFILNFYD